MWKTWSIVASTIDHLCAMHMHPRRRSRRSWIRMEASRTEQHVTRSNPTPTDRTNERWPAPSVRSAVKVQRRPTCRLAHDFFIPPPPPPQSSSDEHASGPRVPTTSASGRGPHLEEGDRTWGPLLFWYQRVDVVGRVRVSTRGGIGLGGGAVHHARHVGEEEFVGVAGTHAARLHAGGIRESPDLGGYPAALLGAARDTTRHDTATDGVLSTISACVVVVAFFFFIFFSLRVHAWVQPCNCIQVSGTPP